MSKILIQEAKKYESEGNISQAIISFKKVLKLQSWGWNPAKIEIIKLFSPSFARSTNTDSDGFWPFVRGGQERKT